MHVLDISLLAIALVALVVLFKTTSKKDTYRQKVNIARCTKYALDVDADDYSWSTRRQFPGKDPEWQCPVGWTDTGCNNGMQGVPESRECRRNKKQKRLSRVKRAILTAGWDDKHQAIDAACKDGVKVYKDRDFNNNGNPDKIIQCDAKNGVSLYVTNLNVSSLKVPAGLNVKATFMNDTETYKGPHDIPFFDKLNDKMTKIKVWAQNAKEPAD